MKSYPKHKPSALYGEKPGAREELYSPNFDANGRRRNWEGILEAQERSGEDIKTPEEVVEKILLRLYARLRIAYGKTEHHTGGRIEVKPRVTAKLLNNLLHVANGVRSAELRNDINRRVRELREDFKSIQR